MRIGFCLFKYFPYGGLQKDFMDIARGCANRGHEVFVYTRSWQGCRPDDFTIRVIESPGMVNHVKYRRFYRQARREIRSDGIDVLVGFNKMPGLDVYFASDPCYSTHMSKRAAWFRLGPRYRHFMDFEGAVFEPGQKTRILVLTEVQKSQYQHAWNTPDVRFTLLPPGIERTTCADENALVYRERIRQELGISDEQRLLLMIGSGFRTKGLDRALLAIQSLPEVLRHSVQLVVIGQDKAVHFRRQAKRMGLEDCVRILPGRPDIPQVMQAGDLLVHPAYSEVAGKVILEAVVAGLPVLVTDVCGYAHHVAAAGAGLVLPSPFSQEQMNKELAMMLVGERYQEWREHGIRYGREQDLYDMAETAVDMIEATR